MRKGKKKDSVQVMEMEKEMDYGPVIEVLKKAFLEWNEKGLEYGAFIDDTEKLKKRLQAYTTLVATCDGVVCGTISYQIRERKNRRWYEDEKYIYCCHFAVLPEYRDRFVAEHLYLYLTRLAQNQGKGCTAFIGDTSINADRLVSSYTKMGFQIVDFVSWENTNYYSYIFRKPITGKRISPVYCFVRYHFCKIKTLLTINKNGKQRRLLRAS